DALFFEEQRHTGAGGFVWSSTVEDDFAIVRKAIAVFLQFLSVNAEGARDGFRVGLKIDRVAQVDDDDFFAAIELCFEFFGSDTGDAQVTEEFAAHIPLAKNPGGESSDD